MSTLPEALTGPARRGCTLPSILDGHNGPISPYRVLALVPQRGITTLSEIYNKLVSVYPGITEDQVKSELWNLVLICGLRLEPGYDFEYQVFHSEQSLSLYLDNCTSVDTTSVLERVPCPGMGEKTHDECGLIKFWHVCSSNPEHHREPVRYNCHHIECPKCYPSWLSQATDRVVARVEGYRDALRMYGMQRTGRLPRTWPARHFSFNPSEEEIDRMVDKARGLVKKWGKDEFLPEALPVAFLEVLRQEVYISLERSGLSGAVVIPHFLRIKDEYKQFAVEYAEQLNQEKPSWEPKYNRYTALLRLPSWRQYFVFSPHAHVVCYGKALEPDDFIKIRPGWTYRNHSTKKNYGGISGVIYYLLTHAPVIQSLKSDKKVQTLTYWGCLSSFYLKCTRREEETQYQLCPECGAVLCYADMSDEGSLLHLDPDRPAVVKVIKRHYEIREPHPGG